MVDEDFVMHGEKANISPNSTSVLTNSQLTSILNLTQPAQTPRNTVAKLSSDEKEEKLSEIFEELTKISADLNTACMGFDKNSRINAIAIRLNGLRAKFGSCCTAPLPVQPVSARPQSARESLRGEKVIIFRNSARAVKSRTKEEVVSHPHLNHNDSSGGEEIDDELRRLVGYESLSVDMLDSVDNMRPRPVENPTLKQKKTTPSKTRKVVASFEKSATTRKVRSASSHNDRDKTMLDMFTRSIEGRRDDGTLAAHWYELRTPRFHREAHKNNVIVKATPKHVAEYQAHLKKQLAAFQTFRSTQNQ